MNPDKMTGVQLGLERAKTDFFEYKGKMYPAGTVFKMKDPKYDFLNDVTAIFMGSLPNLYPGKWAIGYNTDVDRASHHMYHNGHMWKTIMPVEKDDLANRIVEILPGNHYVDMEANHKRYVDDGKEPALIVGWILYIFGMFGATIFYGRVGIWFFLTIVFFVWRHKFKEENCVYYE